MLELQNTFNSISAMMPLFFDDLIIALYAFLGFAVAVYVHMKKKKGEKLSCPLRAKCDVVVNSKYALFLGIPVEYVGMAYFGVIFLYYFILDKFPLFIFPPLVAGVFFMTIAAFCFSVYLLLVQLIALKQFCSWCLLVGLISTFIFLFVIITRTGLVLPILSEYRLIFVMLHIFALVLGLGSATLNDFFFFKFLRDFRISEDEKNILHTFSQIIWIALAIFFVSGLGLFLPESQRLLHSSKFLLKLVVVSVIFGNGIFLNIYIAPKLMNITFGQHAIFAHPSLLLVRKVAFAAGGVSFLSWYTAFVLGMLPSLPFAFWQLLIFYILALICAIVGGLTLENQLAKQATHKHSHPN